MTRFAFALLLSATCLLGAAKADNMPASPRPHPSPAAPSVAMAHSPTCNRPQHVYYVYCRPSCRQAWQYYTACHSRADAEHVLHHLEMYGWEGFVRVR